MRFKLTLLSGVRVVNAKTGAELPLRSYKGIVGALGFADRPLSREELIAAAWPGVELRIGRNRLRVALAKFRSLMPDAVREGEGGLSLDPAHVWSEVAHLRTALDQCQDTVTLESESQALRDALGPAGSGETFDRSAPFAAEFGEFLSKMFVRLADLHAEQGNFESARDAARSATFFCPESCEAWVALLLGHWRLGTPSSGMTDAQRRTPKSVQAEKRFRDTLVQIQTQAPSNIERAAIVKKDFLAELVNSLAGARPDLMRSLLAAPQTLALSGRYPRLMHDYLAMATPLDLEEKDPTWERAAARMIGLKAWLGDADDVIASAPALLEYSEDPAILRATWNSVAVAHSLVRDWDKAFEALEKTDDYSRQIGSEMYVLATKGNGAFFKMQQGRFQEAEEDYRGIIDRHREIDTPQSRFETAVALGNQALIPVFQGDWPEAISRLEHAIAIRSQEGLNLQMGIPQGALALAYGYVGGLNKVAPLMRLSFLDALHSKSVRSQQFTFELAAVLLSQLGDAVYAFSLAQWVEVWRSHTRAPRSEAEAGLVARIPKVSNASPLQGSAVELGRETMRRLRASVPRNRASR